MENQNYMFINDEDIKMGKEYLLKLKCAMLNLATLHWNVTGDNWFEVHENLGDFYEELFKKIDQMVEALLGLGFSDMAVNNTTFIIEAKTYGTKEALSVAQGIIKGVLSDTQFLREQIKFPNSVNTVFDDLENWCHTVANYKIEAYLK